MWERATLLQHFILRALVACKLPTYLTDKEVELNKQGGISLHVLHLIITNCSS